MPSSLRSPFSGPQPELRSGCVRTRRFRALRQLMLCCSVLGCGEGNHTWLMPGLSEVRAETARADSSWVAVPLREYGSWSGEISFGAPIDATVLADGSLVVADLYACTLTVIARPDGRLRHRLGRCGDGPGEFRMIRIIDAFGDSLFVYDQGHGAVVVLDEAGHEMRRVPLEIVGGRSVTLSHLAVVDDSTLVVATESADHAGVALVDSRTGAFRKSLLDAPPIATRSDGWIRHMAACVEPNGRSPTIVATSEWALEGVGLESETGEERFHFLTALDLPPTLASGGAWVPGPARVDVACGRSLALFRVVTVDPDDFTGNVADIRASSVILEARAYDGTLLMRRSIVDTASVLRAPMGAFRGDTVFLLAEKVRPYPVVSEIVLRPR